jgi:hypothetical protein
MRNCQGMLARWLAKLQQFNFTMEYREGKKHANADGLSRCMQCSNVECDGPPRQTGSQPFATSQAGSSLDENVLPMESGELCVANIVPVATDDSIHDFATAQSNDVNVGTVLQWVLSDKFPPTLKDIPDASRELKTMWLGRKNFLLDDKGLLWRRRTSNNNICQLIVPKCYREEILSSYHNSVHAAHQGVTRTYTRVSLRFYWPGLQDAVRDWVAKCNTCASRKSPNSRKQPMGHIDVHYKFDRVAMDILDITSVSDKGNRYVLVIADYFTKYTEAYALANKTAASVADMFMEQWVVRFGFPLVVHSDQGREFENTLFRRLSECGGFNKTRTTPYHPRSDGFVERFNRSCVAMLAMFVNEEKSNWDELLPL